MKTSRLESLTQFLTQVVPENRAQWLEKGWLVFLYLLGIFLWGYFLNWGRGPLNYHDWADINVPRLVFLKDAVSRGVLPLHISDIAPLAYVTDRFMVVPDAVLSPQIWLLKFMEVGTFVIVNTWLLYSLGFWGLARLKKRFQLSLFVFSILFLLYNFNGHLLAHVSVGHITWWSSFLFSWFAVFVFDLIENKTGWVWVAKLSILLFILFLQGGYHQFIWCTLFLGLLIIVVPQRTIDIIKAIGFSFGLSMVRILPPILHLGEFDNKFIGGYPLFSSLWNALVKIEIPNDITINAGLTKPIGLWEYTLYVGLLAGLFLVVFGIIRPLSSSSANSAYRALLIPSLILMIMSLGKIYQYIRLALPIPLFTGERIASRFIGLSFVFILVLAVVELQHWLNTRQLPGTTRLFLMLSTIFPVHDMWMNYRLWRVADAAQKFEAKAFNPSKWFAANRYNDMEYIQILWLGLGISLVSLALLLYFVYREKKTSFKEPESLK